MLYMVIYYLCNEKYRLRLRSHKFRVVGKIYFTALSNGAKAVHSMTTH